MATFRHLSAILAASFLVAPANAQSQDDGMSVAEERMTQAPHIAFARAKSGLETLTAANHQTWDLGGADWSVDLDEGVIEFQNSKRWLISAPVQVIGTYDTRDGSFMWGWDHPSVPGHSARAAQLAFDYGERHELADLTTNPVKIGEDEAWAYTALAAYLSESNGAYRGAMGTTLVYMTFGEVTITKP